MPKKRCTVRWDGVVGEGANDHEMDRLKLSLVVLLNFNSHHIKYLYT
jgi:hypothetical protein